MDANKIEKFIDAGYTKQEIELLFKDPKVDPEPKDNEDKEEVSDNLKMDQMNSQKNIDDSKIDFIAMNNSITSLTETVNALSETVKAMQSANIGSAQGGKAKADSVESVMQSFIEKL